MKKNKLITISILASLLLVPFMIPAAKAAPASYVGVDQEEFYQWYLTMNFANWTSSGFFADGMSDTIGNLFYTPQTERLYEIYASWVTYALNSWWGGTLGTLAPENRSLILSDWGIYTNITHTQMWVEDTYWHIYGPGPAWWSSYYIVNDSASFAELSVYGGFAFSPMMLRSVAFAPNNMNWATFVGWANWGMANYFGAGNPLAANTTVTALADGYSMYVPIAGFENNTKAITINTTYTSAGVLNYSSFEYGAEVLYTYELQLSLTDAVAPVVTSPTDHVLLFNYTGESISWTATDAHPGNYTIKHNGLEVVATTPWAGGTPVVYNITDGLALGNHTFEIDFKDLYLNSKTDEVIVTVYIPDDIDPVLTSTPSDLTDIDIGDVYQEFSWTATDQYAGTYTITRNGTVVVTGMAWTSGTPVT
ncbi:MAG: hypothetical protein ACW96X_11840, partial [Promethearchaeota archaeon]